MASFSIDFEYRSGAIYYEYQDQEINAIINSLNRKKVNSLLNYFVFSIRFSQNSVSIWKDVIKMNFIHKINRAHFVIKSQ